MTTTDNGPGTALAPSGSKARVLADVRRYIEHSDDPMVKSGLAGQIDGTQGMDAIPSKMFEDGGHKIDVMRYLADRAATATMPRTPAEVHRSLEDFFTFCGTFKVPPFVGLFAVWNGVSVQRVNQIERDTSDPRSQSISVCKEAIRAFLEMAAADSSINPIIYFHQNKVYFGAVENQQVTIRVDDNAREISPEEYAERVGQLVEMVEGPDGTFSIPD